MCFNYCDNIAGSITPLIEENLYSGILGSDFDGPNYIKTVITTFST